MRDVIFYEVLVFCLDATDLTSLMSNDLASNAGPPNTDLHLFSGVKSPGKKHYKVVLNISTCGFTVFTLLDIK